MEIIVNIGLRHFLLTALFLFGIGLFGIIISRNLLKILISVAVMFCAVTLIIASFAVYSDFVHFKGIIFGVLITVFTVVNIVVGAAIALNLYKFKNTSDIENIGELKG